jgi:hypothetical protein
VHITRLTCVVAVRSGELGLGLGQTREYAVRALDRAACECAPVEGGQSRGCGGEGTSPGPVPVEEVAVCLGDQVGKSGNKEDDGNDSLRRGGK